MSIASKAKKIVSISLNPSLFFSQTRYFFLLGHMRSRSTVLTHVLGSNEEICGYSELRQSYESYADIVKMRSKLYLDLKCSISGKYLLDKLLHNELDISDQMLEKIRPKVVFLIREPQGTLKSIFNMYENTGVEWHKTPQLWEYYIARLAKLEEHSERLKGNYYFLESDNLVNNTDSVLAGLTSWLELKTPLDSHYSQFNKTGKSGFGDPSEAIREGKIVSTKNDTKIEIPQEALDSATFAYERCVKVLTKNALKTL